MGEEEGLPYGAPMWRIMLHILWVAVRSPFHWRD